MKEQKSETEKLECELKNMLAYVDFEIAKLKKEIKVLEKRIHTLETETIP